MHSSFAVWHILALVAGVCCEEDVNYDPASNFRPRNITDLDYWYYPWKGSYYNGTAIFTVSDLVVRTDRSQYEDTTLCPQLQNMTYIFSWPAILAVTQTEGEDERPKNTNLVDILLVTSYSNFTKYFTDFMDSGNMPIKDMPWSFQSIEASRYAYPEDSEPEFNLTVSSGGGGNAPYRITGSSSLDENPMPSVSMNMSSCSQLEAWWGVSPVSAGESWVDDDNVLGLTDPTLTLTFDQHSAGLLIRTSAIMNTLNEESEEEETPALAGKLTIEFLGRGDAARSDILNGGDEPSWTPTVGFANNSMNLDYGTSGAGSVRGGVEWGLLWGWGVLFYVFMDWS